MNGKRILWKALVLGAVSLFVLALVPEEAQGFQPQPEPPGRQLSSPQQPPAARQLPSQPPAVRPPAAHTGPRLPAGQTPPRLPSPGHVLPPMDAKGAKGLLPALGGAKGTQPLDKTTPKPGLGGAEEKGIIVICKPGQGCAEEKGIIVQ